VRLAPLYDIASILPYDDYDLHKIKLSMKIGGEYGILDIRRRHIEGLGKTVDDIGRGALGGFVFELPNIALGDADDLSELLHR
jgi:hypothetical protein